METVETVETGVSVVPVVPVAPATPVAPAETLDTVETVRKPLFWGEDRAASSILERSTASFNMSRQGVNALKTERY